MRRSDREEMRRSSSTVTTERQVCAGWSGAGSSIQTRLAFSKQATLKVGDAGKPQKSCCFNALLSRWGIFGENFAQGSEHFFSFVTSTFRDEASTKIRCIPTGSHCLNPSSSHNASYTSFTTSSIFCRNKYCRKS